jgi:SAM-dependent methyltransferase
VRRLYEEWWAQAPQAPEPWRFEWRRELLLSELPAGEPWLDLGCGAGRFSALSPGAIGVDVAQAALDRAQATAPGSDLRLVGDDGTLPLAHGEVAFVWCSETLEHVPDALGLLQECRRVLRPGGRLLVTTPAHPLWRRTAIALVRFDAHFDPLGQHVRFFTARSLRHALTAAGFEVEGIRTRHATLVALARRGSPEVRPTGPPPRRARPR